MQKVLLAILFTVLESVILVTILASPAFAKTYNLEFNKQNVLITGKPVQAITINGSIPAPTLRFKDGEDVVINVKNSMDETTSIHWHGILLDGAFDGVPGLNGFHGIAPHTTFTYKFKVRQRGTYWYHSHSNLQEAQGAYGSIIIEPNESNADRDYVIVLSDFSEENPNTILNNLKIDSGYYNFNKRTISTFFKDIKKNGFSATLRDYMDWGSMRMDPTDLSDVTKYHFLTNGKTSSQNWTGIFKKGESVKLRFINASAMTIYDVSIPGLKMKVVEADGQPVKPVLVDEFRFGVAETYDVIVEPQEDKAYTIFSESIDRTGYARGTLAPHQGMSGEIPKMRPRTILTMADMGMGHDHGAMKGMGHDHAGMSHGNKMHDDKMNMKAKGKDTDAMSHEEVDHEKMDHEKMGHEGHEEMSHEEMSHDMGSMDMGSMSMAGMAEMDMNHAKSGWADRGTPEGNKALEYSDLVSLYPQKDLREPIREIEFKFGGSMNRYIWTINNEKFPKPTHLKYGERVRLKFVNETMMAHPIHLHGMFMQMENGQSMERMPNKHTVIVPPAKTVSLLLTADEAGEWAFHCHLLLHMASGMMTSVTVDKDDR